MRTDINNVEEIIRSFLIQQSQLDDAYVKNALSIYGSYADQSYNGIDWSSIETAQSLIFFELRQFIRTNCSCKQTVGSTLR